METYGFDKLLEHYGSGDNLLRTHRLAQPRALKEGDVLATRDVVCSNPKEGFNGAVLLKLETEDGKCEISIPARIPIALLMPEDEGKLLRTARFAQTWALEQGDTLATGDCILSFPREFKNDLISLKLTGGFDGHRISVPKYIPIALLMEEDGIPDDLWVRWRQDK